MSVSARIAFAGTPQFAVPTLEALAAAGVDLDLVLTQPDRPAGRGRHVAASPVKRAAAKRGLAVAQPQTLRRPGALDELGPAPDLLVVIAYGLLLPPEMLAWPRLGCVNLHASLLPRWRGAAPIQHALLARDSTTGVSLMRIERGLDTGAVYLERSTPIGARETAAELHDRLAVLASEILVDALPARLAGKLSPIPQQDALATHAPKITKADAVLDWRRSAADLDARVRAFDPWPVAETQLEDGTRLRVWRAEPLDSEPAARPGTVVRAGAAGIDVATGTGVLRLTQVQPPSGRVMAASAYLAS